MRCFWQRIFFGRFSERCGRRGHPPGCDVDDPLPGMRHAPDQDADLPLRAGRLLACQRLSFNEPERARAGELARAPTPLVLSLPYRRRGWPILLLPGCQAANSGARLFRRVMLRERRARQFLFQVKQTVSCKHDGGQMRDAVGGFFSVLIQLRLLCDFS